MHTHVHHWESDSALLPGFFHSVDCSWLGPHLGWQVSKTPGSGWAPQEEVTFKRDAGRCFCCLPPGGSTGQGGRQDPPLPILLEHASRVTLWPLGQSRSLSPSKGRSLEGSPPQNPALRPVPPERMKTRGRGRVRLSFSRRPPPPRAFQCCDACGLTVF